MTDKFASKGGRTIIKIVLVRAALFTIVNLVLFVKEKKRENCDRAAQHDMQQLGACLERLRNELLDKDCLSRWEFEEKQLAFLIGTYYGWSGTNTGCQARIRASKDEIWGCALKGTKKGEDGSKRHIYRIKFNGGEELTSTMGSCYGQSYGGDHCFIDSIVNKDCSPTYRPISAVTPQEKAACKSINASIESSLSDTSHYAEKSINPFGINMYKTLVQTDDNFFFGVLAAYAQFFTTAEITMGDTQQEILKVLDLK